MMTVDTLMDLLTVLMWFLAAYGLVVLVQDGGRWLARRTAHEVTCEQRRFARGQAAGQEFLEPRSA